jgi:GTP cyclohydrolase FolE2
MGPTNRHTCIQNCLLFLSFLIQVIQLDCHTAMVNILPPTMLIGINMSRIVLSINMVVGGTNHVRTLILTDYMLLQAQRKSANSSVACIIINLKLIIH